MNTHVYDNGGETVDRYTIIIGNDVYTMSQNAMSPNGFNQYAGTLRSGTETNVVLAESRRENPVSLDSLPAQVQAAIKARAALATS